MGVFHAGEREVQRRAGVTAMARDLGQGIGPSIPAGARSFLVVNFASGVTLQITGRARILWDRTSFSDLPGAERAVEVDIGGLWSSRDGSTADGASSSPRLSIPSVT